MIEQKKIRAVIFDLDDTLIDRCTMFWNWAVDFMQQHTELSDASILDVVSRLAAFERRGATPRVEVFRFFESEAEKHRAAFSLAQIQRSYLEDYYRYTVVFDDTLETLAALKEAGYPLGIITNGHKELQGQKIARAGLAALMTVILISEAVGFAKPDKRIFHLAAEQLGYAPSECLYVGDRFEWDVEGPLSAGMHACFYRRNIAEDEQRSFPCMIDRLSELKTLLLS